MKRVVKWILSRKRWLIPAAAVIFLLVLGLFVLPLKKVATYIFVAIWFIHIGLGAGAGYAALRLWYLRANPLIKWMGLYMNAFIIDVLSAILLLFVTKGVTLTWKFSTVLFVSTIISNIFRAPLIFYLIKGPQALPLVPDEEKSGELPPAHWEKYFEKMVTQNESIERRLDNIDNEIKKLKRNGEAQNER
jgi:hypothetical protein